MVAVEEDVGVVARTATTVRVAEVAAMVADALAAEEDTAVTVEEATAVAAEAASGRCLAPTRSQRHLAYVLCLLHFASCRPPAVIKSS